jgi:HlyD family secretion protein
MSRWGLARWLVLGAAVLGGAGLAVVALRGRSTQTQFLTAPVERGDVTVIVSANGTLNPVTLVNVGTQVSGTVKKLNVDYNSRVQQGQVLAVLDERTYAAAVHQSQANVANADAQLELAQANLKRAEELFAKDYVTRQDLDTAREAAKSALAQRALAHAQLDRDRTNLDYTVIRSPVAGVVVSREIDVGQTVAASFQTPTLFKIAQDLSKMQIDSSFAEADVGSIRERQPVRFSVDAYPERVFQGVVRQVRLNPTTVQNVVTYDVVVAVDNPDQSLLPGMTAYVNVVLSERRAVLKVPNAALRFRPPGVEPPTAATPPAGAGNSSPAAAGGAGGSRRPAGSAPRSIFVVRGGAPVAVAVQLGGTDRRYTEIASGDVREGDLVAIGVQGGAAGQQPGAPRVRVF